MLFIVTFSYCIVGDFCQNLSIPHFGMEQPGDTYYYSPLFVYCFGVVDACATPDVLHSYGYSEDIGGKGGNNVASLLMLALENLGWLIPGVAGKQLSIVMDNCTGQNKNKHVLRIALWLVELHYFEKVEFIFYVRGHTKNVCDRMFNLLKKRYHRHQIYTMAQLCHNLNMLPNTNFYTVQSDVFYNYDAMFDRFYKPFKPGTVTRNHVFWVEATSPTVMHTKLFDCSDDVVSFDHCLFSSPACLLSYPGRIQSMKEHVKIALEPPGMKPIKQVELWKKWRKFVPREYWEEICKEPTEETKRNVAFDRNEKQKKNSRRGRKRAGV